MKLYSDLRIILTITKRKKNETAKSFLGFNSDVHPNDIWNVFLICHEYDSKAFELFLALSITAKRCWSVARKTISISNQNNCRENRLRNSKPPEDFKIALNKHSWDINHSVGYLKCNKDEELGVLLFAIFATRSSYRKKIFLLKLILVVMRIFFRFFFIVDNKRKWLCLAGSDVRGGDAREASPDNQKVDFLFDRTWNGVKCMTLLGGWLRNEFSNLSPSIIFPFYSLTAPKSREKREIKIPNMCNCENIAREQ